MSERHFYEPKQGHGLPHDPFNAIVGPRPIGWISTRSAEGVANLAPYSYFNALSQQPPLIGFSSSGRKDSLHNAEATRVFGWSLVTRPLAEAMNASSAMVPADVDEFTLAGLESFEGRVARVPLVAASPVNFECRVADIVHLRNAEGGLSNNWLVTGEVVGVHIRQEALHDGIYDTAAQQPVMRGGGRADYFSVTPQDFFAMARPKA